MRSRNRSTETAQRSGAQTEPIRMTVAGAGLGAWLGLLGGAVLAFLPYTDGLDMVLGGLLIGTGAGALIGLIIHGGTASSRKRPGGAGHPAGAPANKHEPAGAARVTRTALPGVGVSYIVTTADGDRIGVVAYVDGRREVTAYDAGDPDGVLHSTVLTESEARTVAHALGMPMFVDQVADPVSGRLDGRAGLTLSS